MSGASESKRGGEVWLWLASPGELLATLEREAWWPLLSQDEKRRLESFHFERDRAQFLTARILVRRALSAVHPCLPAAWKFRNNPWGRPELEPECGLNFNLSHCPELVACVVAREAAVGVDVETRERAEEILEAGGTVFSEFELSAMAQLDEEARRERALSLWTLKEAWAKAKGLGFSLPLRECSFALGGSSGLELSCSVNVEENVGEWQFCMLDYAGHRVAVAARGVDRPSLAILEMGATGTARVVVRGEALTWLPRGHAG